MIGFKSAGFVRSAVLTVVATLVPLTLFAAVSAYVAVQAKRSELTAQAVADTHALAQSVDQQLRSDMDDAEGLAASPSLDNLKDLTAFRLLAQRERARHPNWRAVLLVDRTGSWVFNTDNPVRRSVVEPASFWRVLTTGKSQIGTVAPGRLGHYGLPIRAPVIRDGKVTAVVTVVELPLGIHQLISALKTPAQWIVTIVDGEGHIAARSHMEAAYLSREPSPGAVRSRARGGDGLYSGLTLENVETLSAYSMSPTTGWSVHIGVPTALLQAPLHKLEALLVAAFLICAVLAGGFILLLLRDGESRRRHAVAIEQAIRIEALGRLTGGVAHDFNNLLTVIQGNAEILSRRLAGNAAAERPLAGIRGAGQRAAQLTRQLLVFARGGGVERSALDLADAIRDMGAAMAQLAGAGIDINLSLDPGAPAILVDPLQFQAAVLNLIANARDAMGGAGRIEVSSRRNGEQIELAVRDTGPGFDKGALPRVFEPFFTTKPVGSGTGLGLSQVYGLVNASGGEVRAGNALGGGGVVTMVFPITLEAPGQDTPSQSARTIKGDGSILLVDDNEAVRSATAAFLREVGFAVVEAADAEQALAAIEQDRVDAVVSDIRMPGEHDGIALAQILFDRAPDLPVLLVSGYSDRASEAQRKGFAVLAKPYSLAELARRLAAMAEAGRVGAA